MKSIASWFLSLGFFGLLTWSGPVRAELITAHMTSQRVIAVPLPFAPTRPPNLQGSVLATATADAVSNTASLEATKLTLVNDPLQPQIPIIMTTPVAISSGAVMSPAGTLAVASAQINLQQSANIVNGNVASALTIDSQQSLNMMLTTNAMSTFATGMARSRDPITLGIDGFGASFLPGGTSLSMDFNFLDAGAVPGGSAYTADGVIFPDSISDPDSLFEPPPPATSSLGLLDALPGAESLFSLRVDHTGLATVITFTPGSVSSSNFTFDYTVAGNSVTPSQIQARVLNYLNGGPGDIFRVTVTLKGDLNNVTLGNQDVLELTVPEPTSLVLGLVGGGFLLAASGRRKRR